MDKMTASDELTIRRFLRYCLRDGLYAFKIDGQTYQLECEEDVERITTAIRTATPPVIRYRVQQAENELLQLQRRHRDLVGV